MKMLTLSLLVLAAGVAGCASAPPPPPPGPPVGQLEPGAEYPTTTGPRNRLPAS